MDRDGNAGVLYERMARALATSAERHIGGLHGSSWLASNHVFCVFVGSLTSMYKVVVGIFNQGIRKSGFGNTRIGNIKSVEALVLCTVGCRILASVILGCCVAYFYDNCLFGFVGSEYITILSPKSRLP